MFRKKKGPEIWVVGDKHLPNMRTLFFKKHLFYSPKKFDKELDSLRRKIENRARAFPYLDASSKKKVEKELSALLEDYYLLNTMRNNAYVTRAEMSLVKKMGKKTPVKEFKEMSRMASHVFKEGEKEAKKEKKRVRQREKEIDSLNSFLFLVKPDVYFTEYEKDPSEKDFLFAKKAKEKGVPIEMIEDEELYKKQLELIKKERKIRGEIKRRILMNEDYSDLMKKHEQLAKASDEIIKTRTKAMAEKVADEINKKGFKKAIVLAGQGHIYLKGEDLGGLDKYLKQKIPNAKIHVIDVGEQKAISKMIYPLVYVKNKAKEFIEEEKLKKVVEKAEKAKKKKAKTRFVEKMRKRK